MLGKERLGSFKESPFYYLLADGAHSECEKRTDTWANKQAQRCLRK